jgi:hypothetical protein
MVFSVRFFDDASRGVSWDLVGPDTAGGKVWEEVNRSADDFRRAVAGLPFYVQGFFAGRGSRDAVAAPRSGGA